MTKNLSKFTVADTVVRFDIPAPDKDFPPAHADKLGSTVPQLSLHPKGLAPVKHRKFLPPDVENKGLPAQWQPVPAFGLDPLIHLKCMDEDQVMGFSQGQTMRLAPSTVALKFVSQKVVKKAGATTVITTLKHPSGLRCEHRLSWVGNVPVFTSSVRVVNAGKKPVTLEMLTSSPISTNSGMVANT